MIELLNGWMTRAKSALKNSWDSYTNLAQVLGAADTMRVRTKIDKLYERAK